MAAAVSEASGGTSGAGSGAKRGGEGSGGDGSGGDGSGGDGSIAGGGLPQASDGLAARAALRGSSVTAATTGRPTLLVVGVREAWLLDLGGSREAVAARPPLARCETVCNGV